jgi:hypothetical protein
MLDDGTSSAVGTARGVCTGASILGSLSSPWRISETDSRSGLRRLWHAVRRSLHSRTVRGAVARQRHRPQPAVAREAARVHLAAQPDAALPGLLAGHGGRARLRLRGARPRDRRHTPENAPRGVPRARHVSRSPRHARRAQGLEDPARDPVQRLARDAAAARGARGAGPADRHGPQRRRAEDLQAIADRLPAGRREAARAIGFVSSNGWDACGAKSFGFRTFWVNRGGVPADALDAAPDHVIRRLDELPALVGAPVS